KRKHLGTGGVGKEAVFSLVERKGRVRSRHIPAVTAKNLRPIVEAQIHNATHVMTDEGGRGQEGRERIFQTRLGQSWRWRVRSRQCSHQHNRGIFFYSQARHLRRLSSRQRTTLEALSCGV